MACASSRGMMIGLKPVRIDQKILDLLDDTELVSVSISGDVGLYGLSSGEVWRVRETSSGSCVEKIKFSSCQISSSAALGSSSAGSGVGIMAAAVAAVVGVPTGGGIGSSTGNRTTINISKIFANFSGSFFIVNTVNGDTYIVPDRGAGMGYLLTSSGQSGGGQMGIVTCAVSLGSSKSGGESLIGTQNGRIYLLTSTINNDRLTDVQSRLVYDFGPSVRITDISNGGGSGSFGGILVSTLTSVWVFGSSGTTTTAFTKPPQLVWESPIGYISSKFFLHNDIPELIDPSSSSTGLTHVSWLNGVSIVTSRLDDLVADGSGSRLVIPHSTTVHGTHFTESLIGQTSEQIEKKFSNKLGNFFCVTPYMYIVQFEGRLLGVSRIQLGQFVAQMNVGTGYGSIHPMSQTSTTSESVLCYSPKRIYELSISNERMNVWKYFLKHKNFIAALRAAANDSERAMVYKSEADYLVKQAASSHDEKTEHSGPDLSRAADIYSKSLTTNQATIAPFMNDIIEKLLVDKFSLIKFLITKIDLAGTGDFDEQVAQVEVCVLFIYICELFVSEILRQPTTNDDMETYFISFISERYSSINFECIKSVYELLETNGLFRLLVVVAESVGDMETAIRIDMEIGNYRDIIRRWSSSLVVGNGSRANEIFERITPILFRFYPNEVVDLLIKSSTSGLAGGGSTEYILSIVTFSGALTIEHKKAAVRLLEYLVLERDSHQPMDSLEIFLNVLVELKCNLAACSSGSVDESPILHLLESVYQKKYFNHDFLTRTVCHYGLKKSRVLLLGIQGRYLKATRMALTEVERLEAMDSRGSNEVSEWMEFAKQIAWRSRNRLVQRCCWLEILRSSVRGSIDGSLCAQTRLIDLFGESEILEIDDLLEIFEFAKISTIDAGIIHQQIIDKLEHLDQRSSSIRKEIDQYSEALELIRNDIRSRNRCGTCAILSYSQKCEICLELVYEGKFMVFNTCGHCFHVNCLTDAFAMKLAGRRSDEDVDEIISKSCVLCGEESMLIEDLFTPFVDPGIDADEIDLWKV